MGLSACDALFDNELPEHDLVPENAIIDENPLKRHCWAFIRTLMIPSITGDT